MMQFAMIAAAGSLAAVSPQSSSLDAQVGLMPAIDASVAYADPPAHARAHGRRDRDARRIYDDRGYYLEPRRLGRDDRIWRDRDGRYRCRRDNGTTGLVIGAGLGALAGRAIDTRGDRTTGTILGAIAGGLLGREIDRGELRCR